MLNEQLAVAIKHRENNEYKQAHTILMALYADYPTHEQVNYQLAWLCDAQGNEREAVPYYEAAINNGLADDELQGALLGLGSTYRCIGEYDSAIKTLLQGLRRFPQNHEFAVFLAMALYNVGKHQDAMALLTRALAETSSDEGIQRYRHAILFYSDKLNETWE